MKRHFSMLREFRLADWFTLGNAFCGTGAVFAAMRFLQDGQRGFLLTGMDKFLDPYKNGLQSLPQSLSRAHDLTADNPAQ